MTKKNKATEDQFSELHNMVTTELANRIKSGDAGTADIRAAIEWLKVNDITGVAFEGSPLDRLASVIPRIDPDAVQRRLYGTTTHS